MYIVQPGSATVKTNGVASSPTRAVRRWPVTGRSTATGTSITPAPGSASGGSGVVSPPPSTRIGFGSAQSV